YCIGADGMVSTVVLLSKVPLDDIRTVKLDPNSRTSNVLVQILAQKLWHREWQFYEKENGVVPEACVMIGDQVFEQKSKYPYHFDLADAWKELTDLPMVFAVWIARPGMPVQVIRQIDSAFEAGWNEVKNGSAPLESWQSEYLLNHISFPFDGRKREALQLFRSWAQDMLPVTTSRLA
ncbi:MAG TPA: MqnA/MqnD/SBP family protein, partial [Saprospiraceae bacterium]|nr:MqnA/MqnD/SBP family protein [Saprospiraceae bacterium]